MNFLHRIVPFSSKRVSLANGYRYCVGSRVLHTERPEVLSDWQYCNMISSELKKNNTDSALQLLLQSYFSDIVLDRQIYHSLHSKLDEVGAPLSYSEVVYSLYREHFKPNALMIKWMVSLLNTEDETILRRVKEDFKTLKLPIPSKPPAKETTREEAEEKLSTQKPAHEERPRNVRGNHSERAADKSKIYKVEKIPQFKESSTFVVSFGDEDRSHVAALINPSLRDFMGAFASVIDQCDRVIVHNIEVTISQDVLEIEEENEQFPYLNEEEQEEQQEEQGGDNQIIGSLKIGKIQFIGKGKDQDKNKNKAE